MAAVTGLFSPRNSIVPPKPSAIAVEATLGVPNRRILSPDRFRARQAAFAVRSLFALRPEHSLRFLDRDHQRHRLDHRSPEAPVLVKGLRLIRNRAHQERAHADRFGGADAGTAGGRPGLAGQGARIGAAARCRPPCKNPTVVADLAAFTRRFRRSLFPDRRRGLKASRSRAIQLRHAAARRVVETPGPAKLPTTSFSGAVSRGRLPRRSICRRGIVTETGSAPSAHRIGCRHASALLPPPSLPARDHPARDLALSPLHPELSRCRGAAGRAWSRRLLRDGAAMGAEVRFRDRATVAPASPSAQQSLAFGRDGGAYRRRADVSVARRG